MPSRPPPAPDSFKFGNYRTFPPEFFAILDRCAKLAPDKALRLGPFTLAQALAGRRAFHRFRSALNEAASLDGDQRDDLAREAASKANDITTRVDPPPPGSATTSIDFTLSPMVAAMRRALAEPEDPT